MSTKHSALISAAIILSAGLFGACEKTNEQALQEQIRETLLDTCPEGCVEPPEHCVIKGNVGGTGQRIYILPQDTDYYAYAFVEPEKGERWFCTEQEARNNGFLPVPR